MKILFANFHPSDGGGRTTYIYELAKKISNTHKVFIVSPRTSTLNKKARDLLNVTVIDMDVYEKEFKYFIHLLHCIRLLVRLINQEKFDVIHVNDLADHRLILYISWIMLKKIPIILTKHNTVSLLSFGDWIRSKFTCATIAVCESVQKNLQTSVYKNKPIFCIPKGVDINFYKPNKDYLFFYKNQFKDKNITFVSVSGTSSYKGWHYLIAAVANMPYIKRKLIKIIIAGEMPDDFIKEKYVNRLGLRDQVIFSGLVEDVRDIISKGDVGFVLSDSIETTSFACREMMAMGKPVLISDYSELPENIDDGINGWITKAGDIESIKNKLCWIIDNPEKIFEMGVNARMKAVSEFSIEKYINKTLHVYKLCKFR